MLASRSAGIILQVLLAGGTDRNTLGVTMIGAMPAVAVRHERRKQEKRKRPSQLYLGGLILRHSPPSRANSLTPSPLQSPLERRDNHQEYYLFGKVSLLHMVVVSLLLGAILLIVGLVQLKPGAHDSQHRYYLMAAGAFLMLLGLFLTAVRCCLLPWRMRKREERMRKADSHMSGMSHGHGGGSSHGSDNDRNAQLENGRHHHRRSVDVRSVDKVQIHSPVSITLQECKEETDSTTVVSPNGSHKNDTHHDAHSGHKTHHGHEHNTHGHAHPHDAAAVAAGATATHGHVSNHGHASNHAGGGHHGGHESYCHDTHGHATHLMHARDIFYDTHGHGRFGVIPCEKIT